MEKMFSFYWAEYSPCSACSLQGHKPPHPNAVEGAGETIQKYPNPFTSEIHVVFDVETRGMFLIDVYWVDERCFSSVNVGFVSEGKHQECMMARGLLQIFIWCG